MKTLIGVLALMLALMFGASNVVVAAEKDEPPSTERLKKLETDMKKPVEKKVDKASPKLITGKVTQADETTKTVTILGTDGERVTLNFSDPKVGACKVGRKPSSSELKRFPKVGDNVVARVSDECAKCLETC